MQREKRFSTTHKRVSALMLAVAVMVTTLFGSVPQTMYAAETETGAEWAAGITDEMQLASQRAVWMDATKSVEERTAALLASMTLEEKAAQMTQPEQKEADGGVTPEKVRELGIGSVLSGGGSAPTTGNTLKDWADRVNAYKAAALESRLGIPLIYGVDAVHGHNNVENTVIFPHNIGLGAAGDEALTQKVGAAAAEEIRATGIQWTFAPTLGVPDSERWGRYYECFGEDANLVSRMGAAYIKGFQGTTEDGNLFAANKVAATAKHYIGEGQTANGTNQGNVELSEKEFDNLMTEKGLLEPYKAAIEAGDRIVMVSYNSVNGVKCHGNKHLLTDILKGEATAENPLGLGFTGFVVSDYNGVDQLPNATYEEKVADSINAGVDMFMEPYDWQNFIDAVIHGYENGTITAGRIDDAVTRILRVKFEMGLFEETVAGAEELALYEQVGSEAHRGVAQEAVEKSLTVLKNDSVGNTGKTALQILEGAQKILVGGYKANDIGAQCGGWTISWQGGLDSANGSGGKKVTAGTTIYEGFLQEAGAGVTVSYNARGKIAAGMDAAVVVVGEDPYAESNGDKTAAELTLTETDKNVIKTAVSSAGDTPLILVLMTGRPVAIADYIDSFDAVVEAWLPGTEGDGIAAVMLDSSKDFAGTMPVTWTWYPQDLEEKYTDASKVLFPYGTGLKKDGSSILPDGQTAIPTQRPEAPQGGESAAVITRNGGVDIEAYDGKLEGEFAKPTSGTFNSWNIGTGSENDNGVSVGYAEWDAREWGNAKWVAYIRQAGTYKVTARIKVTAAGNENFTFGISTAVTGDGKDGMLKIPAAVTTGYQEVELGTVEIPETGLHGIKVMDGNSPGLIRAKLDYLKFEIVTPDGERDDTADEPIADPTDETVPQAVGNLISNDAVRVYMTSTEKSQNMSWYKYPTEMANQLSEKEPLDITSYNDSDDTTIYVDESKTYQELLGMGTSLEESTINNLSQLTPEVQDEFLRKLVDPAQGGMTLFRITIGTSDFTSKTFYTYYDAKELNETNAVLNNVTGEYEPDWQNTTGNGFTIQKDIDYKIVDTVQKVIALAKEYGVEDEVKFFASSWTPPGWMKNETASSESYKDNELLIKGGSLKDEAIADLAMYYTRYLEEYAKQGIDIYAITLQNEPMLEIDYPSCAITGEQEGKLAVAIKEAVSASTVLNAAQKECKLWAFDHNPGDAYAYVKKILSVDGANEALDGIAFHDYGGSLTNMQNVLDELLNKGGRTDQTVGLTERSVWGTSGANSIITYLRNGAISYNSWVTMLDSNVGVHQWVGTPDPTMFARSAGSDNDYWAMPEFYITGQFARFIRPGDVRIDSNLGSTDTVTNVVFQNPETKEYTAVVVNASARKQNFKIVTGGTQFIGSIPAGNIATYVWSNPTYIHSELQNGFAADAYNSASEGVTADTDHSIIMQADTDYADYVIDVKEAGTYQVRIEEMCGSDNQTIQIIQGDTTLREIAVLNHGEKKTVQGVIELAANGVQQIRIKASSGIRLYKLALIKTKERHQVPGKILADEFCDTTTTLAVADDHTVGSMGWWGILNYKVNVPADDTYRLTLSTAVAVTEEPTGFYVTLDGNGDEDEIASCMTGWGMIDFTMSGDWGTYVTNTVEIELTKGEHTIGIKGAYPMNIAWLSIGSSVDLTADTITEGAEDGKTVTAVITGGTLAEAAELKEGAEVVTVEGLPAGVTARTEFTGTENNEVKLTLSGNRTVDFDKDIEAAVTIYVKQPNGNIYPVTENFIITAVQDEETIAVTTADTSVPSAVGETKTLTLSLTGGTFDKNQLDGIAVAGDAAEFYSLQEVSYVDDATLELVLKYNKIFYRGVSLTITVPAAAYDEGTKVLSAAVSMQPADGFPEAIKLTSEQAVVLTEDKAYANKGSLAENVAAGNYIDYFLDVKEAGTYVVTYTLHTLTSDGTSYANAWEVNRGVPQTIGTNSYKQVSIPGLWLNSAILMRHTIELSAGIQTLEFKAKSGGYEISQIQLEPCTPIAIEAEDQKVNTILAGSFYDYAEACIINGENVEYTVAGTALNYRVNVPAAGTYQLVMNYAVESSSAASLSAAAVTDSGEVTELGKIALPKTGAWSVFKDSAAMEIKLPAGTYTLRLNVGGDGANLKKFTLTNLSKEEVKPDTPEPENPAPEDPAPEDPQPEKDVLVNALVISKKSLTLNAKKTAALSVTVSPSNAANKTVAWSSSNTKVAAVNANGVVTAVAAGKAVITAKAKDGSGVSASCTVTVKVPATSVKLNVKKKTIYKGSTYTLKAAAAPKSTTDTLTWSSSNKKVATVDGTGKVTAKKKGTATITVKTTSGKKAVCKITVKEVKSTKVTLNKTKLTLKKGKSYTLKASMAPKKATDTLKWTSSNKKIATVSATGKVTAKKKGTATITVKTASGKKAVCKVQVK